MTAPAWQFKRAGVWELRAGDRCFAVVRRWRAQWQLEMPGRDDGYFETCKEAQTAAERRVRR
jgi:hypothetical protein